MLGLRVTRHVNRFQAMSETLNLVARNGFAPATIIDAGANVGDWSRLARGIFRDAMIHMIEPQSGCAQDLRALAASEDAMRFHNVAITRPGVRKVSMAGGGPMSKSTGAWVMEYTDPAPDTQLSDATTLDELFPPGTPQPILLKLDLEGHEMAALEGAENLLSVVEVVVSEVSLFDVNNSGRPLFSDLLAFLKSRNFELYDLASMSARQRDGRLRQADAVFVRTDSALSADRAWE